MEREGKRFTTNDGDSWWWLSVEKKKEGSERKARAASRKKTSKERRGRKSSLLCTLKRGWGAREIIKEKPIPGRKNPTPSPKRAWGGGGCQGGGEGGDDILTGDKLKSNRVKRGPKKLVSKAQKKKVTSHRKSVPKKYGGNSGSKLQRKRGGNE